MKLSKLLSRISLLVVLLICIASAFGVAGSWVYFKDVEPYEKNYAFGMGEFDYWTGAETLPDDVEGEDHSHLIAMVLNGVIKDENGNDKAIGINNPNSYLSEQIKDRSTSWLFKTDIIASMDYWEGEEITEYFDLATQGLSFLLYFPEGSGNTYYLFTTNIDFGENNSPNIPIDETIYPIYRTTLELNNETGKYEAVKTETGYADSAYYENRITGSWLIKSPSFNPDSWNAGELGDTFNNAINAYVGQTVVAYPKAADQKVYYKVTLTRNQKIVVSSENTACQINAYNPNQGQVSVTSGKRDSNLLGFTASSRGTYYIAVSGATSLTFTITAG